MFIFSRLCLLFLIASVSKPNDYDSKDIFKNVSDLVLMLIMTSQLWKFMKWSKLRKLNISRTENDFSMK